jgi:hypothetical protein
MPAKKTNVLKPGDRSPINIDMPNIDPALLSKAAELKARMAEIYKELNRLEIEKNKQVKQSEKTQQEINKKSFSNYAKIIQKDCSEYIQAVAAAKKVLFRGTQPQALSAYVGQSHKKRKTKDTSSAIQTGVDKVLASKGFTALRHNSIFTSSRVEIASDYGIPYIIFPKNGFSFTWSPKIQDFYHDFIEEHDITTWSEFISHYGLDPSSIYVDLDFLSDTLQSIIYVLQNIGLKFPIHQKQIGKIENEIYNLKELLDEDQEISPYPSIAIKQVNNYIKRLTKIIQGIEISPDIKSVFYKDAKDYDYLNSIKNYQNTLQKINEELKTPELSGTAVLRNLAYTNQNLEAALKSGHEVMINGEYYAFKYDVYRDILKYLR